MKRETVATGLTQQTVMFFPTIQRAELATAEHIKGDACQCVFRGPVADLEAADSRQLDDSGEELAQSLTKSGQRRPHPVADFCFSLTGGCVFRALVDINHIPKHPGGRRDLLTPRRSVCLARSTEVILKVNGRERESQGHIAWWLRQVVAPKVKAGHRGTVEPPSPKRT